MIKISPRTKKTSFQLELPEANEVALVGDFNEWNGDATPMKKLKSGVWKADLVLDEGEYEFRYLVDGNNWVNDEATEVRRNQFGTANSVVHVEIPTPKTKKASAKKASKNGKK